jgi:hypothetical protein
MCGATDWFEANFVSDCDPTPAITLTSTQVVAAKKNAMKLIPTP